MIPQLRVRTGYDFRRAFGSVDRVAERLVEIGTPVAGIVDEGTWGHVPWEKALTKAGIQPAFGVSLPVASGARSWALAEDLARFYTWASSNPQDEAAWASVDGVIRFAGAGLSDPACFDYVDVRPESLHGARHSLALAAATGKPLVLAADNIYPGPDDRLTALTLESRAATGISLGSGIGCRWIPSDEEMRKAFWFLDDSTYETAKRNTFEVAERLQGKKLAKAPMIHVEGDLIALVKRGVASRLARGHIAEWTPEYQARLERELELIAAKQFESYFLVVADLVSWAKTKMLVGPARGSSAGSLVCYVLDITEVDPLQFGLIFERFIDVNRADLPDIDIDFNDAKRHLCFEYLAERYGTANVARIGNVMSLMAKSAISQGARTLGIPFGATFSLSNVLVEHSSGDSRYGKGLEDTMLTTDPGRAFIERYPEAKYICDIEGHPWGTSVHAAGAIVSSVPVTDYCTVLDGVACLNKFDAEYLNLLKIDVLGLRTLGVIEDAGVVTAEELYALRFDDPAVHAVFNRHQYAGIFQFEGASQRSVAVGVPVNSLLQIDHVTALARPGPLGSGAATRYTARCNGLEPVEYKHAALEPMTRETMGVVLYQEQTMRIVRDIGHFSWEDTSFIRKAMSSRKGDEYFGQKRLEFIDGAQEHGLTEEEAASIWDELRKMGSWTMNKAHTVSYAVISYWCAWMKAYHPLEYAAAILRNAKDESQTIEILRELVAEGVPFKPFDIDRSQQSWAAVDGMLLGGFDNLLGFGPVKSQTMLLKRQQGLLTDADRAKLAKIAYKVDDLRPAHTRYGHIYADPDSEGIDGKVWEFAELPDGKSCVVLCKVVSRKRSDKNEALAVAKRNGRIIKGQTAFADMYVVDDSVAQPARVRIETKLWHLYGQAICDRAIDNADWFLVRGRWASKYSMFMAEKIRCLTNPELFK